MAAGLTTTSSPSVNFTPWMIFGNWLWPSSLRQLEIENGRLKKLVAERDLEIEVMKEINSKKW